MNSNVTIEEISNLLDQKIYVLKKDLEQSLDEKLEEKLEKKLDEKFAPVYKRLDNLDERLTKVELTQENKILPAINELTSVYLSTYKTFEKKAEQIDILVEDVEVLKTVVQKHSEQLKKIS